MSDRGKIENEIINYSVSRGNKYNQTGNERAAPMDDDSGFRRAIKVGNRNSSHLLQLVQRDTVTQIPLEIYTKFSHLQNYPSKIFTLTSNRVQSPKTYRIINSTSTSTNVITENKKIADYHGIETI